MKRLLLAGLILCGCAKEEDRVSQSIEVRGRMCALELAYDGTLVRDTLRNIFMGDTLIGTSKHNIAFDRGSTVTVNVCHLISPQQYGPITITSTGELEPASITSGDSCAWLSL